MPAERRAPRVYVITDRHATGGRPLEETLAEVLGAVRATSIPASAVAIQLREKDLPGRALLALARPLRALTANAGVRLFINDRIDVALAVGADGVHLGGGSLPLDDVQAIAPRLDIALSTHRLDEVARSAADPRVSFVVFGPVFDTPSKRAFGPPLGLDMLRAACAFPIPVLALGGVEADQIPACFAAGASGVASIRALVPNLDPELGPGRFFGAIERT